MVPSSAAAWDFNECPKSPLNGNEALWSGQGGELSEAIVLQRNIVRDKCFHCTPHKVVSSFPFSSRPRAFP